MSELGKLVHRAPHKGELPVTEDEGKNDKFVPFLIRHECFEQAGEIGTMDLCPYLKAGACTWFSRSPVEEVAQIGITSGPVVRYDFAARATSRIQSSKSATNDERYLDAVFEAVPTHGLPMQEVWTPSTSFSHHHPEGVDSPISQRVQPKQSNIASYRQKAGRVGRGCQRRSMTLATDSPLDLHFIANLESGIESFGTSPIERAQ